MEGILNFYTQIHLDVIEQNESQMKHIQENKIVKKALEVYPLKYIPKMNRNEV